MGGWVGPESHGLPRVGFGGGGIAMEDLRVAAVVMRSRVGKKAENLARMESFVVQAAQKGAQAICFPEMSIRGYGLRQEMGSFAEPIPGPSTEAVLEMARAHRLLILAGL